jgi:hypothetical protein
MSNDDSDCEARVTEEPALVAYKGFDLNFRCRGHQFAVGETYEIDGDIEVCKLGFHACEFPLDVFSYYQPGVSRFAQVRQSGAMIRDSDDTKIASDRITIEAELTVPQFIEKAIAWITSKLEPANAEHATGDQSASSATGYRSASSATGDQSASSATGDRSASSATGYRSASSATGYRSASNVSGKGAVAMAIGRDSRSKAGEDGAIVCVYRDEDWNLVHIRAAKVGGPEGIKPDVWYTLNSENEFVEIKTDA